MLELIVCVDNNWGFAKQETIPWHFKEDLKFFASMTKTVLDSNKKNIIIMGRKTWDCIPPNIRPLKDRINIVVSRSLTEENKDNLLFVKTIDDAVKIGAMMVIENKVEKVFMIGGLTIYEYAIQSVLFSKAHITKINRNYECDRFFPYQLMFEKANHNMILDRTITENNEQLTFMTFESKEKYTGEDQYNHLLWDIMMNGDYRATRNANTRSLFGRELKFNLSDGFPLLTCKRTFMRGVFEELKFFLQGKTDTKELATKGVHIWDANTTREFLDKCGLNLEEGSLGPLYGFQMKYFDAQYETSHTDYTGKGFDQIKYVIDTLKKNRYSRRILMTTYNPIMANQAPLFPCHGIAIQFHCKNNRLNCSMMQRSCDTVCGLPFNIASYALLIHIMCELVNNSNDFTGEKFIPGELIIYLGDVHIYDEITHTNAVLEHITRMPYPFCKLNFKKHFDTIDNLMWEDIELVNYQSHPSIKVNMIA